MIDDEGLHNFLPAKVRNRETYLPFSELDYDLRSPSDEYKIIKEIEDKVLWFNENLKKEAQEAKAAAGLDIEGEG